jgi:hypothetical protein
MSEVDVVITETPMEKAWELMRRHNLDFSQRIEIRTAISEWAREFNPDVTKNTFNTWTNKTVPSWGFERESEAEFIGALVKFMPNADPEKLLQVMSMMLKLFDVDSAWSWNGNKTK